MANNSGQMSMTELDTQMNSANSTMLKTPQDPNLNTAGYYGDGGVNKGTVDQSVGTHARPYGPEY